MRPDRHEVGLLKAWVASLRGTCRVKVGACITDLDGRVLLDGYAGSPPGEPHCTDVGIGCSWYMRGGMEAVIAHQRYSVTGDKSFLNDLFTSVSRHCKRTIHAERNIIAVAAREGIRLKGAVWYTYPFAPCDECAQLILVTQPSLVVWPESVDPVFDYYASSLYLEERKVNTLSYPFYAPTYTQLSDFASVTQLEA